MRNFFSYALITIGVVLALGGFLFNIYLQASNWNMTEWGIIINYPFEVLGIIVSMIGGYVLFHLGITTSR